MDGDVSQARSADDALLTRPAFGGQLVLLAINGAIGGFLFGYDTGTMSACLLQMKEPSTLSPCPGLQPSGLDLIQQELVTSFVVLGAFLGAVGAGPCSLYYGRRRMLLVGSFFFMLGAVMMAFSTNLAYMLISRIITGLGVGISSHTVPLYISECAPPDLRGSFCFMNDMMIVVGQFTAAIISTLLFYKEIPNGWRWILGLGALPAVFMFLGFAFQPESPRWLLSQNRSEEAKGVLKALRGETADTVAVQTEFQNMADAIAAENVDSNHECSCAYVLHTYIMDPRVRRALLLGCGLQFLQQWSGINTIIYYGATVLQYASKENLEDANTCFTPENKANVAWTILFSSGQLPAVIIAWCLVDRLGRRPLILVSTALAAIFLVACGCVFSANDVSEPAVIVCVMLYLFSFGLGMSPVPWTVNAEIYPLSVRAQCITCSTATNWLNNFVVAATFLSLATALSTHRDDPSDHPDGVFWLYATFLIVGFMCLYWTMPETNGLTLEQIGGLFKDPDDFETLRP